MIMTKINKKIHFFLFALAAISSCTLSNSEKLKSLPKMPYGNYPEQISAASPEFEQGWKNGCEVGSASGSNTFYKIFYKSNKVDGYKVAGSQDYSRAYGNAFWYCYRAAHIKHKSSIWGSIFSGYR